jgi:hypothetical protein
MEQEEGNVLVMGGGVHGPGHIPCDPESVADPMPDPSGLRNILCASSLSVVPVSPDSLGHS